MDITLFIFRVVLVVCILFVLAILVHRWYERDRYKPLDFSVFDNAYRQSLDLPAIDAHEFPNDRD